MAKFTTDGIYFLEVPQELLDKFPHSLLSVMKCWYGDVYAIGLDLKKTELDCLVMAYSIALNKEDFEFLAKDLEIKAVKSAFC